MLRLSAGCIRATQAAELQQLSAHPYTAVCHLGEDGSQGNLCLTYRGLKQILISAIYFICGSYALCRVFLAFSNSRPRRRLHAETYMLNRLRHGGRVGHISSHLKKNAVLKNPFTLSMGVINYYPLRLSRPLRLLISMDMSTPYG